MILPNAVLLGMSWDGVVGWVVGWVVGGKVPSIVAPKKKRRLGFFLDVVFFFPEKKTCDGLLAIEISA